MNCLWTCSPCCVQIWSALDLKQYLLATRLYLLSRHIYNTVQLDPNSAAVVGRFPLLARQWASICHFKAAILQVCVCVEVLTFVKCLLRIHQNED